MSQETSETLPQVNPGFTQEELEFHKSLCGLKYIKGKIDESTKYEKRFKIDEKPLLSIINNLIGTYKSFFDITRAEKIAPR